VHFIAANRGNSLKGAFMAFNLSGAVTGATVPGFTSPTYTVTADIAPTTSGKQWAVTALGGTQASVDLNSVSKPFTVTFTRPTTLRTLPQANPITGLVKSFPMNTYKVITRKGVLPLANQANKVARIYTVIEVPAGADVTEPEDLKAMVSAHIGCLSNQSSGIADTILTGVM